MTQDTCPVPLRELALVHSHLDGVVRDVPRETEVVELDVVPAGERFVTLDEEITLWTTLSVDQLLCDVIAILIDVRVR